MLSKSRYQKISCFKVLIKEHSQPPLNWAMGRIGQLHEGSDGLLRVVTLKTMDGELKRPVQKICHLPDSCQKLEPEMDDDTDDENFQPSNCYTTRSLRLLTLCLSLVMSVAKGAEDYVQKVIFVHDGKIVVRGFTECLIDRQGVTYQWKRENGDVPGLWFGSIRYDCSGQTGFLESKLECVEAGLYNPINDRIVGCEHDVLKYSVGVFFGLLIACVALLFKHYGLYRKLSSACTKHGYFLSVDKEDSRASKMHESHARMFRNEPEGEFENFDEEMMGKKRSERLKKKSEYGWRLVCCFVVCLDFALCKCK